MNKSFKGGRLMYDSRLLQSYAISRANVGPIGPYLSGYVAFLQQHQYSSETIKSDVQAACAFSRWLDRRQIALREVSEQVLEHYRGRFRRKRRRPSLPTKVCGLPKLLNWMRNEGTIAFPTRAPENEQQRWVACFERHLTNVHGVSQATSQKYLRCAVRFLAAMFGKSDPDWTTITADRVRDFVTNDSRQHNVRDTVCGLRATLRFLIIEKVIHAGLIGAVPSIRKPRLADIPCYLPAIDVQRVIAVCDSKKPIDIRDKTIIMLLARLGLRAGEIARIALDDIDWSEERLLVRKGKTNRERVLPLAEDLGRLIVRYLRHARPRSTHRALFIRHRAPFSPLSSYTISWIAACRLKQAGVTAAHFGSHVFRHSAATQMVRRGTSLKDIADILGHQHLGTTNIYAKLDLPSLVCVAIPWPGGQR